MMNNTEQNYTDNFFKQGLSSPPEFHPSDKNWEEMERLLASKAKRHSMAWIYAVSGIAAAILIFLFLWFVPEKTDNASQKAKKINSKETKPATREVAKSSPGIVKQDDSGLPSNNALSDNGLNPPSSPFKNAVLSGRNSESVNQKYASPAPGDLPVAGNHTQTDLINSAAFQNIQTNFGGKFASQRNIEIVKPVATLASADIADSEDSDARAPSSVGKWSLSLAVSPDFNSVNDMSNGNLGGSMGIGVNYRLGKALSVGTGIYYSQKLYSANKNSYKVTEKPFATWTSYSKKIEADCRVIDVPVNLSMRIRNTPDNKIYASAGMSSYFMLSEKYEFVYNVSPAYPTGRREYTIKNENKHILNIVNLAIALEKPLSDRVSLVIQPYAKIPLTGIGKGQTDLKSVGIGFGLNYGGKKKKKL